MFLFHFFLITRFIVGVSVLLFVLFPFVPFPLLVVNLVITITMVIFVVSGNKLFWILFFEAAMSPPEA